MIESSRGPRSGPDKGNTEEHLFRLQCCRLRYGAAKHISGYFSPPHGSLAGPRGYSYLFGYQTTRLNAVGFAQEGGKSRLDAHQA